MMMVALVRHHEGPWSFDYHLNNDALVEVWQTCRGRDLDDTANNGRRVRVVTLEEARDDYDLDLPPREKGWADHE